MDNKELEQLFDGNTTVKRHFVNFYTTTDRSEKEYNKNWKDKKCKVDFTTAMTYLDKEDVQNAIKEVYKENRTIKMLQIYDAMCEKALKGDANSAKWVENFNNSNFFGDTKSAIDKIVDGLEVD